MLDRPFGFNIYPVDIRPVVDKDDRRVFFIQGEDPEVPIAVHGFQFAGNHRLAATAIRHPAGQKPVEALLFNKES